MRVARAAQRAELFVPHRQHDGVVRARSGAAMGAKAVFVMRPAASTHGSNTHLRVVAPSNACNDVDHARVAQVGAVFLNASPRIRMRAPTGLMPCAPSA